MTYNEVYQIIAEWLIEHTATEPLYVALYDGSSSDTLDALGIVIEWLASDTTPTEIYTLTMDWVFPADTYTGEERDDVKEAMIFILTTLIFGR